MKREGARTVVNAGRVQLLKAGSIAGSEVVYWMSRDQRLHDNWALLYAQEIAIERKLPLTVIFCLLPDFLQATWRQYEFMIKGLEQVEKGCAKFGIKFGLLMGNPIDEIPRYVADCGAAVVVTDFTALRKNRDWKKGIAEKLAVPFIEVDTHNVVPCRVASDKLEFAAYTIRPKIRKLLREYLTEFPKMKKHPFAPVALTLPMDWDAARRSLKIDRSIGEAAGFESGETAAGKVMDYFLKSKLRHYDTDRNLPQVDGQSNLSPYLHFGQISAQRVALEAQRFDQNLTAQEAFLEELIIRRELADNYCHYNEIYDAFEGFHPWAQKTLNEHRADAREYIYSRNDFESAQTHDELWNAAQLEMVTTGKMHGYMRMYWAKKILEWSPSPEDALATAIYLNDRYELDGRDPNGYTGIAWSIGGVHDRPWTNRPIFGMVRYMSYDGCKRKFDVKAYIAKHSKQGQLF